MGQFVSENNELVVCAEKYRRCRTVDIRRGHLLRCLQTSDWRDTVAAAQNQSEVANAFVSSGSNCHLDLLQAFLDNGINVNIKDHHGNTALMSVSYYGSDECARLLLDHNANVDLQDKLLRSALIYATSNNNIHVAEMLLEKKAYVDFQDYDGRTALMGASQESHSEIVALLLNHNADVALKDKKGKTALDYACNEQIKRMIRNHVNNSYVLK